MKKEMVILERLGTITLLGWLQATLKISLCTAFLYLGSIFASAQECILLGISIFASDNFHTLTILQEQSTYHPNAVSSLALQQKQTRAITFF